MGLSMGLSMGTTAKITLAGALIGAAVTLSVATAHAQCPDMARRPGTAARRATPCRAATVRLIEVPLAGVAELERLPAGLHRAGRQLCAVSRSRRRRLANLERLPAWLHDSGWRLPALSRPLNLLISRRCNAEPNAGCARACRERNSAWRAAFSGNEPHGGARVACAKAHVLAEMISRTDAVSRET
jgi:hypothetical protein